MVSPPWIFGPLSSAFGSIEPQQRGSLHIHFLFFSYAFDNPETLVRRFADQLPLLETRLWQRIQSLVVTAFEAVPPFFDLPVSHLARLRPLPYSDANLRAMHAVYNDHVIRSTDHWFAADPERLQPAQDFLPNPFALDLPSDKPFVPWCLDYLPSLHNLPEDSTAKKLFFDLCTSVVNSGLLHSCQAKTCSKGKLGKRRYCRLGFWHWLPIAPHTWERRHGIALCPRPPLGVDPPHTDSFWTERHHHFFGRADPTILAACKCSHDVSTSLRFPACSETTAPDAAERIQQRMATSMSTLLFYVTCYTRKTQPQLLSLWSLLHTATTKLQQDLQQAEAPTEPRERARTTLSRLLLAGQKKVHKSMQEMISYLLGHEKRCL